jgi:hypothetical protein
VGRDGEGQQHRRQNNLSHRNLRFGCPVQRGRPDNVSGTP